MVKATASGKSVAVAHNHGNFIKGAAVPDPDPTVANDARTAVDVEADAQSGSLADAGGAAVATGDNTIAVSKSRASAVTSSVAKSDVTA